MAKAIIICTYNPSHKARVTKNTILILWALAHYLD